MEGKENPLDQLGVKFVDQDELEHDITKRANEALIDKDTELDQKRLDKANNDYNKVISKLRILRNKLSNPRTKISQRKLLKDECEWIEKNEMEPLKQDIVDITNRLNENKMQLNESKTQGNQKKSTQSINEKLPGESERDFLIRTGKITAFGNENAFHQDKTKDSDDTKSHVFLRAPGFEDVSFTSKDDEDFTYSSTENATPVSEINKRKHLEMEGSESESDFSPVEDIKDALEEEFTDNDNVIDDDYDIYSTQKDDLIEANEQRNVDDGDEQLYQIRLKNWVKRRSELRKGDVTTNDKEEWFKPHPTIPDAVLNSKFKLPGDIYPSLFDYQKTCVQWLWELYSQKTGGIIGDEMGLGKTIQIISFLAGLHYSGLLEKPVLVVVPATVMNQWVNEFHRWWPPLRCVILHSIGSGMGKNAVQSEEKIEAFLETTDPTSVRNDSFKGINSQIRAKEIIDTVMEKGHVLVTTYVGLRIYSKYILPREWGYVVLDEGHKIRNPDLDISLTCKQIKTYNRIILSGTPIQNNLIELWSLFDFIFPGRLGTLPVFEQQFSVPINMGGYANASNVQVQTGYKCAVILRDLISPYLLRRLKSDVAQDLPKKNEMVLFVKLTQYQQDLYEKFLNSEDLHAILKGKRNILMGVDILRKICNHPDLVDRDILMRRKNYNYGNPAKSGKLQVLKNLLQLWQMQGHRTLLFCQTKQMLDILEKFVTNLPSINEKGEEVRGAFNYLRMDGSTHIGKRQALVDTFNEDKQYHVFLLTTKVGGLGINLTGADRVIIYDPDWNPSTDIQARERAWRLGQTKDITIYRLMTAGSIEEKIYHRQIFKTFLTNKILKDPKQRRFFKVNDLHDLFSLGDQDEVGTETGDLFNGSETKFNGNKDRKSNKLFKPKHKNDDDFYQVASISGVSKLDNFEGDTQEKDDEQDGNKDENRIMEGLFANSGVHSALKHDDIMDSSKQEVSIIEKEANRVAAEAAEALKQSRKLTRKNNIGTPTWTGKFGLAGKFGPKTNKRINLSSNNKSSKLLSSTSILSELKQKKDKTDTVFTKKSTKSDKKLDREETLDKLISFLAQQTDQFSTSNNILSNLKLELNDEKDMILIRSMLREIAVWDSSRKGWVLKVDFSANS